MRERGGAPVWLIALALAALALFALAPLLRLLAAALTRGGAFSVQALVQVLGSRAALAALEHSLVTGIVSSIFALAIGGSAALIVGLARVRGRRLFSFLFVLTLLMAPQVAALAFLAAAGPSSPVLGLLGLAPAPGTPNPLRSAGGIILVLSLHHAPLAFITLRAGLRQVPRALLEAAALEGAGPWLVLRRIVLPLMRRHIVVAGLLCFAAAFGNFGIPALLGLPVNYLTLPTLIYRRLTSFGPSVIGDMAALSVVTALIAMAAILAVRLLGGRVVWLDHDRGVRGFWAAGRWRWLFQLWLAFLVGLVLVVPLVCLLWEALAPAAGVAVNATTVTLENFREVLIRQAVTVRAFRNSFLYAGTAGLVCALLAGPVAYAMVRLLPRWRGAMEALFDAPYALPGIVVAIAAILLFLRPLPLVGISLYGTGAIIVFAYLARFFTLALKPVAAVLAQMEPAIDEAASLCGATAWQKLVFIALPVFAPAALAGGVMIFLIAFNELTVSALLWSAGTETIGVVMFGLEEAGLSGQAAATALASVAVVLVAAAILELAGRRLPPDILPWR